MSLYSLALLVSSAQALPAGSFNETSLDTSVEASCTDNCRSLWSIVSTCLLTIFACVYTSIHPNVPSPYDRPPAILRRAVGIMLVAVLAPELIVGWAARQWVSARAFTKRMRDCLLEVDRREQEQRRHPVIQEKGPGSTQRRHGSSNAVDSRTSNDSHHASPMGDEAANCDQLTSEGNGSPKEVQGSDGSADGVPSMRGGFSGNTSASFDAKDSSPNDSCETENFDESRRPLMPPATSESSIRKPIDSPQPRWKPMKKTWFYENEEDETWTTTHSFYAYMGGFMVYHNEEPWLTITPLRLLDAVRDGNIKPIKLTKREIADASKGNFISKGLVVLQVTWFCVQLIARRIYGLAITPLEVGTAGFAILCFITYALWWNKPLNVDHPRRLEWKAGVPPNDLHEDSIHWFTNDVSDTWDFLSNLVGQTMGNLHLRVETFGGDDVTKLSNDWTTFKDQPAATIREFVKDQLVIVCFIGALASTVFGLVHVAAWGLLFPTRVEKVTWEVGAILIVCIPLAGPFIIWASIRFFEALDDLFNLPNALHPAFELIFSTLLIISPVLYVVSRITLIIIMLTSLRSLPLGSFETIPWVELIPHL